jgi:hypothetical protein
MDEIWTERQVKSLEARQANWRFHPYTCRCHGQNLTPTKQGWKCPVSEQVVQTWAHEDDLDDSIK